MTTIHLKDRKDRQRRNSQRLLLVIVIAIILIILSLLPEIVHAGSCINGVNCQAPTATRIRHTRTPTDVPPTDTSVPPTPTLAPSVTHAPTATHVPPTITATFPQKSTWTPTLTLTATQPPTATWTATSARHIDVPSSTPTRTATVDAPYWTQAPTCDMCDLLGTIAAAQSTQAAAQSTLASKP